MIFLFTTKNHTINTLLSLRSAAISIQIILILLATLVLSYSLPIKPLITIVMVELLFTAYSFFRYKQDKKIEQSAIFIQVLADVIFLSLLLYYSGGATNAFVSLLLIPIAIATVTLPLWMLLSTATLSIASYSIMLWLMLTMHTSSHDHGNMQGHYIAMWVNFLFSTLVVALVVSKLARTINQRELAIAHYREEQLKQEKIIALGIASAQVTHQLATPIATVQLLADELKEDFPNNIVVDTLQTQLKRCSQSLHDYRQMTVDIDKQEIQPIACSVIIKQIKEHLNLNYPEIKLTPNSFKKEEKEHKILADLSLLPAILNLINNAVRATKDNNQHVIELNTEIKNNNWLFTIRDFGCGFNLSMLEELGIQPVSSEQGLGMAVFLSHVSLERLGGNLELTNHQQGGALVTLTLPLIENFEAVF